MFVVKILSTHVIKEQRGGGGVALESKTIELVGSKKNLLSTWTRAHLLVQWDILPTTG